MLHIHAGHFAEANGIARRGTAHGHLYACVRERLSSAQMHGDGGSSWRWQPYMRAQSETNVRMCVLRGINYVAPIVNQIGAIYGTRASRPTARCKKFPITILLA